jgi:type VI secretion system protein ImpM
VSGPAGPVGVFGKLPALGDFLLRGLPAGFADPWHAWLADGLVTCRDLLGDDWLAAYLEAPVWRFALAGGTCGPDLVTGVLMPSVDAVGRYFFLTLAFPASISLEAAPRGPEGWYDSLDTLAREALDEPFALDPWLGRVRDLPAPEVREAEARVLFWRPASPGIEAVASASDRLPVGDAFAWLLDGPRLPEPAESSMEPAAP